MSSSSLLSSINDRPLNRGAACLPCRKLKAKCDGGKPACARCLANHRPDDCEYATGAEVTRSRLLEENIALLEARIAELENPGENTPSVTLQHPGTRGGGASLPRTQSALSSPLDIPLYQAQAAQPLANVPAPTPQEIQMLMQTFMANASQLGFFLNPTRFRRYSTTHDALRNAVLLWGSHLSPSPVLRAREAQFADDATQAAAVTMLGNSSPQGTGVLHTIQAEVLLANYFFATTRLLEGRYHCIAAVALVTASKFHLLNAITMGVDPVSDGENVQAFWMVVTQDKMWSAVMDTSPSSCPGRQCHVTTPLPLSTEAYERGLVVPPNGSNYTMEDFIRGAVAPNESNDDFSPLAIRTKASALYEQALYLTSQYQPDMPNRNEFLAQFNTLDSLIDRFHRQLAAIRNRSTDDMRELLVSRTVACAAGIQLHSVSNSQRPSWQRTVLMALSAARALDIVDISSSPHLDPVIAILWLSICKVLITELRRIRQSAVPASQEEANVISGLDRITGAMSMLSYYSPLMGTHLAEIQELMRL